MQEYREGHRFDDSEEPVRKNILKHIAFFYGKDPGGVPAAGRHLDRFVRFMLMAAELDHDACKEPENVDAAFPHLLDMPVVEFRAKVIGRLTKGRHVLSEALKTMGVRLSQEDKTARPLTVVGGWLLALGAFRTVDPGRDWDQVFNLTDLNNEELQYYKLLSPQELIGYKQSLRLFFTLCQRLFENVHPTAARPHGPLLQVTARSEAGGKQGGLFFHLDFSYMQPCLGRDKSLKERIEDYWKAVDRGQDPQKHGASGALGQFRQIQDPGGVWEDPTAQGANLCLVHVRPVSLSSRDEATEVYFT
ncbi:MAG: hypothetical protein JO112_21420 [Planctomycetes bacterium]|nr:hypothetical protein [Planctomycetota bacterium]